MNHVETYPNGYGVSVISNGLGSDKGLLEIAVLHINEHDDYDICYATPITRDVIGNLTLEDVGQITRLIKELPEKKGCTHSATVVVQVFVKDGHSHTPLLYLDPGWSDENMITDDAVCTEVQNVLGQTHEVSVDSYYRTLIDHERLDNSERTLVWCVL